MVLAEVKEEENSSSFNISIAVGVILLMITVLATIFKKDKRVFSISDEEFS